MVAVIKLKISGTENGANNILSGWTGANDVFKIDRSLPVMLLQKLHGRFRINF